jgi:hypothetical protein
MASNAFPNAAKLDNTELRGESSRGESSRGESSRGESSRGESRGEYVPSRNEHGQFASMRQDAPLPSKDYKMDERSSDMVSMLRHIESLEGKLSAKEKALLEAQQRVEKFSARTREGMQSALDSLMKKWMDACETKDEKCKEQFKHGMEKLVQNSAEENGVWQMMVAASALHQRQEHDLDQLRVENNELKQRVHGHYATSSSRTDASLGKRKAEEDPAVDQNHDQAENLWASFAEECSRF